MSAKKINLKRKNDYNSDIIKNILINHSDLSNKITLPEDIKQINLSTNKEEKNNDNDLIKSNNSYNNLNSLSQNNEEKLSSDGEGEEGLSENNYNSEENQNILNINNDEEDKINLIKKQNKKIDELFNLLESRDKEINILQNENQYLYKYKNEFEILEKENLKITKILNKYEQDLNTGSQEIENLKNKIINYENFSQELEYNFTK